MDNDAYQKRLLKLERLVLLRQRSALHTEIFTPPTNEPIVVRFDGGPLDGEIRAMQQPLPTIYAVQRFLRHDARYYLVGNVYHFEGEPSDA